MGQLKATFDGLGGFGREFWVMNSTYLDLYCLPNEREGFWLVNQNYGTCSRRIVQ